MRVIIKLGTIFSIILIVLMGCSEDTGESNSRKDTSELVLKRPQEDSISIKKELTLYPEDKIIEKEPLSWGVYYFNGFIGEDTLTFSDTDEMGTVVVYQQAEKGLVFKLKQIKNYTFEIIDFNRKENYVKLKAQRINTAKNSEGKSDEDEKLTITN